MPGSLSVSHFAIAALLAGLALAAPARAGDTEIRDFGIKIDGKPAGEHHMTIVRHDDGGVTVHDEADVHVTFYLVYKYNYTYRGTEVWKGGKLVRLDSSSNDDGKKYTLSAVAEGNVLRVLVNGSTSTARSDVWTSSYFQLPPAQYRNQAVPLLDADTGRQNNGTLSFVENVSMNVAGQTQNAAHYRVAGLNTAELWYDSRERLVRQEWTEDGHRCQMELVRIRK